jgi:hypothetical protein
MDLQRAAPVDVTICTDTLGVALKIGSSTDPTVSMRNMALNVAGFGSKYTALIRGF